MRFKGKGLRRGFAALTGTAMMIAAATSAFAQDEESADTPRFECDFSDLDGVGADPGAAVTIDLTRTEREVLNLAIPGYIADLEKEYEGTQDTFPNRAFGLDLFISTTVPCIEKKINGELGVTLNPDESISNVTFNSFERVAAQIMLSIWNSRDGVLAHHIRGCRRSQELRNAEEFNNPRFPNLCSTFFPLADAAGSLFRKVTRDQRP